MENDKPNYYSILPASVRYHPKLSSGEKLLYSEIVALTNKEGFCWANNTYFSNLYNKDNGTISRWIQNLIKHGFIFSELGLNNSRKIYILEGGVSSKMPRGSKQKCTEGILKNAEYNTKYNTKKNINAETSSAKDISLKENAVKEWNFEVALDKMELKEGSYLDIIATFIREKGIICENSKQLSAVISRNSRVAKQIEGAYSMDQFFKTIDFIKKDSFKSNYDWGMETIYKKLTNGIYVKKN